jgi:transposase
MRAGRPKKELRLTQEERAVLERIVARRKSGAAEVERAQIVLGCAQGRTNRQIASELGLCEQTVGTWRERFRQQRLKGLGDVYRAGAPRQISDEKVAEVIRRTLRSKPDAATHWSTRTLAAECELSHQSVSRIWKIFGLQPHRQKSFNLSTDPLFVEKVRDVVGLYMSPPQNAVVFCVDEKSQIQALDRSQPLLPMGSGRPERRCSDCFRHGTVSLFAALDVKTGHVIGSTHQRHTQREFLDFLRQIEDHVEPSLSIHVVLDNYATHKTPAITRWLVRHPRWNLHFIPTPSSWLNQVERFFAELTNKRLRRGVFRNLRQLVQAISDYLDAHNAKPKPFRWTATANLILNKIHHFCNELR